MAKREAKILILDDDRAILSAAKLFLKQLYSYVQTLDSPENLSKTLEEISFDLVLLDMNLKKGNNEGEDGLALITSILEKHPEIDIIPITAYGDIQLAVEAMKKGARDFITKPWQNKKLHSLIDYLLDKKYQSFDQKDSQHKLDSSIQIIGRSPSFLKILNDGKKAAATDASILILGENGTGKQLLAQFLHDHSERKNGPFVTVDVGSLTESLFESELFGYVKGAFTDAKEDTEGKISAANKGTLFLDEIGNISVQQQSKLLTVLQKNQIYKVGSNKAEHVDIRIIAATNANLSELIENGEFRQDLLYRINTIELSIPPLRERKEDISVLADYYLSKYKIAYDKAGLKLTKDVYEALENNDWPGNIRELSHTIERAVILADEKSLSPANFSFKPYSSEEESASLNIQEMEKSLILKALEQNKGNITRAAKDLGIDRLALYRRLEKYGL